MRSAAPAIFLLSLATMFAAASSLAEPALLLPQAMPAPEEATPEPGFGRSFAISGDVAVVGAQIGSFFVSAEPPDPGGAVYVFEKNSAGVWHQTAKFQPDYAGALYGLSVAVEGRVIAVGAPWSSVTHVYEDLGAGWVRTALIDGPGENGFRVALDNGTLAISTTTPHGVRLYQKQSGVWTLIATLPGGNNYGGSDYRGPRIDISGNRVIHHSPGDNFTDPEEPQRVYIHTRPPGGSWSAATRTFFEDNIDRTVALSGNVAVVGGVIREFNGTSWQAVDTRPALDIEADIEGDLVVSGSVRQRDATGQWPHVASLLDDAGRPLGLSKISGRRTLSSPGKGEYDGIAIHDIPLDLQRAPLRQDDFQDGDSNGWTVTSGSFAVVATTHTAVYRQSSLAGNASALLNDTYETHQAIQADIRPTAFDGADRWFGLVARYVDANNYYYVTARSSNVVQLKKIVGGVVQTLGSLPLAVQANRDYRLRLETLGDRIRLHVDDRLAFDVRDSSLLQGRAGVMMYKTAANYDNVIWHGNPQQLNFSSGFEPNETATMYLEGPTYDWTVATVNSSRVLHYPNANGGTPIYTVGARTANQSASVAARALSFNGADRWFGLAIRYLGAQNYYYLTMRNSNTVSLRKLVNGTIHTLDTASFTVAANSWYRLRLECVGNSLRGYVDGQLLVEANDAALETTAAGSAALVLYKTEAQYDNLSSAQP